MVDGRSAPDAMLIHVPHSSVEIPADIRRSILLDDQALAREMLATVDRHTDVLFDLPGVRRVVCPFCRLVVDPERFRDDDAEPMAAYGRGAVYLSTVEGRPLRSLASGERERMLVRFYEPYHAALEAEVERILAEHGRCVIVDGHSFSSSPLSFESDRSVPRPDLCIGTCDFHTPETLAAAIEGMAKEHGLSVAKNRPYAGTLVPARHYRRDRRVSSVMIELNRSLYMDEGTGERSPGFAETRSFVERLLRTVSEAH